ncbi:MAG: co-chaperone GroES [Chloroflexi bacterium]|nr:co-chaperone GroES [Chloroflexota bacterium]
MTLQPLGTRVLVRPDEQDSRTTTGIYLPETSKEKPQQGLVIAVGDDETIKVKPNDKVLFAKYTGTEVRLEGADHLILEAMTSSDQSE